MKTVRTTGKKQRQHSRAAVDFGFFLYIHYTHSHLSAYRNGYLTVLFCFDCYCCCPTINCLQKPLAGARFAVASAGNVNMFSNHSSTEMLSELPMPLNLGVAVVYVIHITYTHCELANLATIDCSPRPSWLMFSAQAQAQTKQTTHQMQLDHFPMSRRDFHFKGSQFP